MTGDGRRATGDGRRATGDGRRLKRNVHTACRSLSFESPPILEITMRRRLFGIFLGPILLALASARAVFDSLVALPNERAFRLKHLARAPQMRPQLDAFRDSVSRSAPITEAVRTAQRFLPPGATSVGEPPLVAFAVFRDDGYSL